MSEQFLIVAADRSIPAGKLMFWGPNRSGYTSDIDAAGRYTALELCMCNLDPGDVWISERQLLRFLVSRNKATESYLKAMANRSYRLKQLVALEHDAGYSLEDAQRRAAVRLRVEYEYQDYRQAKGGAL